MSLLDPDEVAQNQRKATGEYLSVGVLKQAGLLCNESRDI